MALLQVIKWDDENSNDVFAWRYVNTKNPARSNEIGNWTQLIVEENQEAIFIRDGQALDLYGPGRHSLSTDIIPVLRHIMTIPTGGESASKAGLWFVNKINVLDIKWGTPSPLLLRDPDYKIPVYVRAYGQFGIRVNNSRQFVLKLAGNKNKITREDLENNFRGLLLSRMSDMLATYIAHKKITIFEINAYLEDMSDEAVEKLKPAFEDYGIECVNFYFNSVNVNDDDEGIKKLKQALSDRASMDIIGFNYQQKRSFDVMESAAKNEGAGAGMMSAGMGLGAGFGMGGAFGQMASQIGQNVNANINNNSQVQPQQNNNNAALCPKCNQPLTPGALFCAFCGTRLTCPDCGANLIPGAKFCANCGKQIQI